MAELDAQISTLEERLKQLKLRAQRMEARKKALESKTERKAETRRKILIGAVVRAKTDQKTLREEQLRVWLDQALPRPDVRSLFGLQPHPNETHPRHSLYTVHSDLLCGIDSHTRNAVRRMSSKPVTIVGIDCATQSKNTGLAVGLF